MNRDDEPLPKAPGDMLLEVLASVDFWLIVALAIAVMAMGREPWRI